MRILFIEDDYITISSIVDHLRIQGKTVDVVSEVQDAIDRIESETYDVIFSDIMLGPGEYFSLEETHDGRYTGLKILEYIRKREKEKRLPQQRVIMISNWREEPVVDETIKSNGSILMKKPLQIREVDGHL